MSSGLFPLHPGVRLLAWMVVLLPITLVVPFYPLIALLGVGLASVKPAVRRHWAVLMLRSRWLLLVIASSLFLAIPGEYLWPGYPGTIEGLMAAATQILRLLAVLLAVAWLLDAPPNLLLAGLYAVAHTLLRPLGWAHLAERAAIRTALVFKVLDQEARDWRQLLGDDGEIGAAAGTPVEHVIIETGPLQRGDYLVLVGGVVIAGASVWLTL